MSTERVKTSAKRPVTVVEISGSWLKIIHAEPARQGIAVSKAHVAPVDVNDPALAETIRDIFEMQKIPRVLTVGCMPRQMVTVRMLDLPSTDPEEIGDMVDLQSSKQTPYSREEVVFDYRILGVGQGGYTKVMLAIVQRSVLRERHLLFEEAGIDIDYMSISSEGLLNWLNTTRPSTPGGLMVLDVDASCTDCSFFSGGCLVFTRSIQMGAQGLRDGGQKALKRFVGDVRRSLEVCQNDVQGVSAHNVIITGGSPAVPGLVEALREGLALPVEQVRSANCVTREPREKPMADVAAQGVSLTSVIGVAAGLQDMVFRFLPDSVRYRRRLFERARRTARFAMLLLTLFVALSCCASVSFYLQYSHLDALKTETAETSLAARRVQEQRGVINEIALRALSEGAVVRQLSQLHDGTPKGIAYDHVETDLSKQQITLEGSGKSIREIRELIKKLDEGVVFKDVKEDGATTLDPTTKRYRFRVVCKLEGEAGE